MPLAWLFLQAIHHLWKLNKCFRGILTKTERKEILFTLGLEPSENVPTFKIYINLFSETTTLPFHIVSRKDSIDSSDHISQINGHTSVK